MAPPMPRLAREPEAAQPALVTCLPSHGGRTSSARTGFATARRTGLTEMSAMIRPPPVSAAPGSRLGASQASRLLTGDGKSSQLVPEDHSIDLPWELLTPGLRVASSESEHTADQLASMGMPEPSPSTVEKRAQAAVQAAAPLSPEQDARMKRLASLPWWNRKYKGVYSTRGGFRASMWHGSKMHHCRVSFAVLAGTSHVVTCLIATFVPPAASTNTQCSW